MVRGEEAEEALAVGWVVQALTGHFTGSGSFSDCDGRHEGMGLSLGLASSDFCFNRIALATVWKYTQR